MAFREPVKRRDSIEPNLASLDPYESRRRLYWKSRSWLWERDRERYSRSRLRERVLDLDLERDLDLDRDMERS